MLDEAKQWVKDLEYTLVKMAKKYNTTIEHMDKAFTQFYKEGGGDYSKGSPNWFEAFEMCYATIVEEEGEWKW